MSDIKASGSLCHLLDGLANELMRTSAEDCEEAATALCNNETVAHQALGVAMFHVSKSQGGDDLKRLWDHIHQVAQDQARERKTAAGRVSWRTRQSLPQGPATALAAIPE